MSPPKCSAGGFFTFPSLNCSGLGQNPGGDSPSKKAQLWDSSLIPPPVTALVYISQIYYILHTLFLWYMCICNMHIWCILYVCMYVCWCILLFNSFHSIYYTYMNIYIHIGYIKLDFPRQVVVLVGKCLTLFSIIVACPSLDTLSNLNIYIYIIYMKYIM